MKKYITVELDAMAVEIDGCNRVNIGDLLSKYNFSITKNTNEEKLNIVTRELSDSKESIIVGFAVHNFSDIKYVQNQLKSKNQELSGIFVPSSQRLKKRIDEATEIAHLHGRWIGSSEEEVEKNFKEFKAVLQEIKEGLKDTAIEVIEC